MTSLDTRWQWALLASASLILAWFFHRAGFPAALLIGPMIAAIAFGASGALLQVPRFGFLAAQAVIGTLVARAFTAPIVVSIAHAWMLMLLVVLTTVIAGGIVGFLLARYGHLPGATAAWGSAPGGASVMIAMSEEFGADPRLVGFMQYLRVIVVVLTASFVSRILLGEHAPVIAPAAPVVSFHIFAAAQTIALAALSAFAGWRLRIPAGSVLGPMTVLGALHAAGFLEIVLPGWLVALAYIAIGWYVGLGFTRETLLYALRAVPQLLFSTFALIALCGLSAWMLTYLLHTDALTAYLATSPGGIDSMAIIAVGGGANVPFVLAIQTLRFVVVILSGPPLARLISHYA